MPAVGPRCGDVPQLQCDPDDRLGVIVARFGHTSRDHVRVADGLDLLEPRPLHDRVEVREHLVEHPDHLLRRQHSQRAA